MTRQDRDGRVIRRHVQGCAHNDRNSATLDPSLLAPWTLTAFSSDCWRRPVEPGEVRQRRFPWILD